MGKKKKPERDALYLGKIQEWEDKGKPEKAMDIKRAMAEDMTLEEYYEWVLDYDLGDSDEAAEIAERVQEILGEVEIEVVPSFNFAPPEAIPPRSGKGSSKESWEEFAKEYSDIDAEVIDGTDKKSLIEMLEVNQVIPTN